MAYSPYISNVEAWKHEFTQPNYKYKNFYTLKRSGQHGEKMDSIKLVTPTEQAVERAKSALEENDKLEKFIPHEYIKKVVSKSKPQSTIKRRKSKTSTSKTSRKKGTSFRK